MILNGVKLDRTLGGCKLKRAVSHLSATLVFAECSNVGLSTRDRGMGRVTEYSCRSQRLCRARRFLKHSHSCARTVLPSPYMHTWSQN